MKVLFFVIGMLFSLSSVFSQTGVDTRPLKIGSQVPNSTIKNIINYHDSDGKLSTVAKLSDFKGKLLILDFWATWCSACIMNFPKMESLQKQFGDKIQILAVTNQERKTIINFFSSAAGKQYTITSVVNDSVLNKMFPHQLIPHHVWINGEGKVIAITDAEEVTASNIQKVIVQGESKLALKKDINSDKPLFIAEDIPITERTYYSILRKGYYNGLGSGTRFRNYGNIVHGRAFTNSPLLLMYQSISRELFEQLGDSYSDKRMILEVKEPSKITVNMSVLNNGTWDTGNLYNYDLVVPVAKSDSLYQYMISDLNRYTDYHIKIVKRKVKCYILINKDKNKSIQSEGGHPENTLFYKKPYHLINCPLSYLVSMLNEEKVVKLPIVDETNIHKNVDIELSGNLDIDSLRYDLGKYHMDLIEAYRELNMLVISDK